jgi:serine/threonine-protein kinase
MHKIGRYEILKRLGGGGFGEVFLGHDTHIERDVAIKVFKPKDENLIAFATSSTEEGLAILRKRFLQEAKILASLEDALYVINVFDFGELEDGSPWYAMPYVADNLGNRLGSDIFDKRAIAELAEDQRPKALELEQALSWLHQIIQGLASSHAQNLVHRDIKPANILVTDKGDIRIADFGIAKAPDSQQSTVSHLGMGSRNYMAPEQRESAKHVDARADVYSVGRLAYRMITGVLPVGRFSDPNVIQPGLNQALNDVILKAINEDPDQRYANCSEMLIAFDDAKTQTANTNDPNATSATMVEGPSSKLRDEVVPLKNRITELLLHHGELPTNSKLELKALAAIADVDDEALKALIRDVHKINEKVLLPKRNFLKFLNSELEKSPSGLDEATQTALISTGQSVGFSVDQIEACIAKHQQMSEPKVSPQAKPTQRSTPVASEPEQVRTKPKKGIMLVVVIIVCLLGAFIYSSNQSSNKVEPSKPAQIATAKIKPADQPETTVKTNPADQPKTSVATSINSSVNTTQLQINTLLASAVEDVNSNRLTSPAGNNALEKYQQVIKLNANNSQAKEGLNTIAGKYLSWAQSQITASDLPKAQGYVDKADSIDPMHPKMTSVKAKLAAAKARNAEEKAELAAAKARKAEEIAAREIVEGAPVPVWSVGDYWSFGGDFGNSRVRVVGEKVINGVLAYEVKGEDSTSGYKITQYFTKADLSNFLMKMTIAGNEHEYDWHSKLIEGQEWPMAVGNKWTRQFKDYKAYYEVLGKETISTKAGTFEAYKVLQKLDNAVVGFRQDNTYWFSIKVKHYVKMASATYYYDKNLKLGLKNSTSQRELLEYRLAK